jgi:hypothetical protein
MHVVKNRKRNLFDVFLVMGIDSIRNALLLFKILGPLLELGTISKVGLVHYYNTAKRGRREVAQKLTVG